ncbi:MAG: glycoside hydrolase family 88 protein [Lachnospiraceae bacterium]|nr:glycoside hydrolase family 88 protein [Lachnospiraceae bacterium]
MGNDDYAWAGRVADKIYEKMKMSVMRNRDKIPYLAADGIFDDWSDRISWWTNGFYGGQLWQLYHAYGDGIFRQAAKNIEDKLDQSLADYMGMDHDSGFKWLLTAVANYKKTGSARSKNRALLAAANLVGRFNLAGRFIRAWNDEGNGDTAGWAIIDCMMNLPLLYWAGQETNDPRFTQIAKAHADTAVKAFIRENGSASHIVQFDVDTGKIKGTLGGQGMETGSSWTRGQAWAVYGFALSYRHTRIEKYLETAKKAAVYFESCIPGNGIIPVDFCQDKELGWEDSSAAAIAACGMLEIETHVTEEEKGFFHKTAMKLLKTLEENRSNWDTDVDYIIENCSVAYHDDKHNFPMVYGDYYFTEAVFKLCGKELFLW